MTENGHPRDEESLDELVEEYRRREQTDETRVLESMCQENPERAAELREHVTVWLNSRESVDEAPKSPPAWVREAREPEVRQIGQYQILGELGRGGMGVVYLARDDRLDRQVALKTLMSRFSGSEAAVERFEREQRAIAHLNHPGIVPIYEVGKEGGHSFFTMEYVEGLTLAEMIHALRDRDLAPEQLTGADLLATLPQTRRADELEDDTLAFEEGRAAGRAAFGGSYVEAVARCLLQIAEALAHAHQQSVIHRDVKPSNILMRRDGHAQLFDFGLARLASETQLTQTGDLAGTPSYLSPEQIAARPSGIDERTDVYSLGVTLYEALTLEVPFRGETTPQVLKQVLAAEPRSPHEKNSAIPRDLETICLTAMEKDRDRRYASARALADDLRGFLEFRPIQARPIGPVSRLWRLARRHRAVATAIGLTALLVLGAPTGFWLVERAHSQRLQKLRRAEQTALMHAEENFQLARDAVESMLARVGRDRLAHVPGMRKIQREILDDALRFHRQFLDLRRDDPAARADVTRSLVSLAQVLASLSQIQEAEDCYREALALAADDSAGRMIQGDGWVGLGKLLWEQGKWSEAEEAYGLALELRRGLLRADPTSMARRRDTQAILANLATVDAEQGRVQPARERYEEALALLDADAPLTTEDVASTVAAIEAQYGVLLLEVGEAEPSRDQLERARERLERLIPAGGDVELEERLATVHENLGLLAWAGSQAGRSYDEEGESGVAMMRDRELLPVVRMSHLVRGGGENENTLAEAESHLGRAQSVAEGLSGRFPSVPFYRGELARVRNNLGLVLLDLGRIDEAIALLVQSHRVASELHENAPTDWASGRTAAASAANLASLRRATGDTAAAVKLCSEAVEVLEASFKDRPPRARDRATQLRARLDLARSLELHGDLAKAREALAPARAALEAGTPILSDEGWRVELLRALELDAGLAVRSGSWTDAVGIARRLRDGFELPRAGSRAAAPLPWISRRIETLESQLGEWIMGTRGLSDEVYEWALEGCEAGLEIEGLSAEGLGLQAALMFRLGRPEEASPVIRSCLDLQEVFGPRSQDLTWAARIFQATDATSDARAAVASLKSQVEDLGELATAYERLHLATAQAAVGDLEAARSEASRGRAALSEEGDAPDLLMQAMLRELDELLAAGDSDGSHR